MTTVALASIVILTFLSLLCGRGLAEVFLKILEWLTSPEEQKTKDRQRRNQEKWDNGTFWYKCTTMFLWVVVPLFLVTVALLCFDAEVTGQL